MEKLFLVHYGEIGLKRGNRSFFEKKLAQNIKMSLKGMGCTEVRRIYGRLLVMLHPEAAIEKIRERLGRVMGIAHFELVLAVEQTLDAIQDAALELVKDRQFKTLKVETKRANKRFPLTSPEISAAVGAHLLSATGASADMHTPDLRCNIEIVDEAAYIYVEKIRGIGGLPVGASGKVLVMLSGGIDSPVAAWRMMKRGGKALFVHFYSYPYTDRASLEKVEELAEILATWNYRTQVYFVPFAEVQREIVTQTPARFRVILYRRMMVRIAQQIAAAAKAECLVTGESLGQVASQTLVNLRVIEEVAEIPILRPLIGNDKAEIMELAEQIGTFEISILPHDDCCSLFVPEHPATNASLEAVQEAEAALDVNTLAKLAVESVKKKIIDKKVTL